jgi:hypothetical protein
MRCHYGCHELLECQVARPTGVDGGEEPSCQEQIVARITESRIILSVYVVD